MAALATPTSPGLARLSTAAASLRNEVGLARLGLGLVALHVVDDNWLQPNPGTSAGDHLFAGLVPLLLFVTAIVFYPRLRAGARASVALFGGYVGILVGTEAVHYTSAAGPSGDDFTGLLAIPAGLLLVGLSVWTLWASRRRDDARWWRYSRRLLYLGGLFVLANAVLLPLTVGYVVTHASRAYVPAPHLGAPYEDVEFKTSDGLTLKGWYIASRNGAAVIDFPGRKSTQERATFLADHGYGVLLFDRRGEGESEGDPNLLGWQGERDIHAAVEYLQGRPDVDPQRIGGIGLSVGGEMMIEAAAESNALKAIVSEGASGRSVRDIAANPGSSWDEYIGTGVITVATALFTDNAPPADLQSLVPKMSAAAFFIYGERGQPAEEPANTAFYEAARGPKEIWEVPGSGHMGGTKAQPQEYERRVVAFFDRHLLHTGPAQEGRQ
jgi:dienelactone hydrolase